MGLLKPRTATIPIYQGDDLDILADLHRAAEVAERRAQEAANAPRRGGDAIPTSQAERAAYDAFVDEASERAVTVTLTALGSKRWRELLAEHPARTEQVDGRNVTIEDDREHGADTTTLPMALLSYNLDGRRTITDPELSADDLREFLEDEISEGDFEQLWTTAYWLNRAEGIDPKDTKFSPGSPRPVEN